MNTKNTVVRLVGMLIIISSIFISNGCKSEMQITSPGGTSGGATAKNSIISGQVINTATGIPVDSAFVQIMGTSIYQTALTNAQGKYSATVSLTSNTDVVIYVSKTGFIQDTTAISVTYGVDYSVSLISLKSSTGTQKPSGNPVSIYLLNQSTPNIGVQGSGSVETATLTFVAVDSSGTPIDLDHSVTVNFSLGANPGGNVTISPASVSTNDLGQAAVNITSGTIAGVVQVYAAITEGSKNIYSQPVSISIYGGLPDYNHFSLSSSIMNFPDPSGIDLWQNYPQVIKIFVGDKYANPVRPQTTVYLTSTGGYIQGSILTDQMGTAKADFVVANPYPVDPVLGPGFAKIIATTADENKQTIARSIYVYFSGDALLTNISPMSFNIPNGGYQNFTYQVSDKYGNPLASGTNISVAVQGVNVASQGDVQVSLPDTQDKAWTHFQFTVYDTNDTVNVANPCQITITVTSPNGNPAPQTIIGTSR